MSEDIAVAHEDNPTLREDSPTLVNNLVLVETEPEFETESNSESTPSSESESDFSNTSDEEELEIITQRDDITLAESITDEIRRGVYTCLVCTSEIDQDSKIWSCHLCYRVYDLDCIKSWAIKSTSTELDRKWRCPACNGKHHKIPKLYTCWCGKIVNPISNMLNPHSCSNTCNHKLHSCSHGCSMSCHPGPHLKSCGAIGPVMSCHCGDKEQQVPCVMTPYESGWNCGKICQDLMPCGEHKCPRTCHEGLCGLCNEIVVGKCYCGKHEKEMFCYEKKPQESFNGDSKWIGVYQCQTVCNHAFDCGNHFCERECHPQSDASHECPFNPTSVHTCHCGKVSIDKLIPGGRQSCLDPIPTCENPCGKKLPCGHECIWNCHDGECSPCFKQFTVKCSCHYSQFRVSCKFLQDGCVPKCNHKCQAMLNCRRHRCNRICCADEPVAMNRERERKKLIRKLQLAANEDDSMEIELVHICTKECGKLLSCGLHYCQRGCHIGACPPCLESDSNDLVCSCGKTVVAAPVRCGTKLPPCPHPCLKVPECGHPRIPHNCHESDVDCPKCTKLVVRQCQCHRKIAVQKVMCFQESVSCGLACGKPLVCGHKCLKSCHKPGECLKKCLSKCGAIKSCGHADTSPCHYPKECNESLTCSTKVKLTCPCGRIVKELACGATLTQNSIKDKILECDDECERVERNRKLFEALQIGVTKPSTATPRESLLSDDIIDKLLELENPYSKQILSLYSRQRNWCLTIEKIFRKLLLSNDIFKSTYHFQPMIKQQREFVHELAEIYKFYSQSQDQEPKRSVMIQKLQSSKVPTMTLEEGFKFYTKVKEREQFKHNQLINGVKELTLQNKDIYFNAILIKDVFFGITRDDIDHNISDILNSIKLTSSIEKPFQINFINETSYALYPANHTQTCMKLENDLYLLKKKVLKSLKNASMAFDCKLCKLDETGSIVYEIEGASPPEKSDLGDDVGEKIADEAEVVSGENNNDDDDDGGGEKKKLVAVVEDQQWW